MTVRERERVAEIREMSGTRMGIKKNKKKKTRNRVYFQERKRIESRRECVCARERKRERDKGGGGISWVRTVILRHDWLCQGEISSLHIPLPSHLQGPGIKRWRTPPRAPLH